MSSKTPTPNITHTSTKGWFSDTLEVLVSPTQRALVYRGGELAGWLMPGNHTLKGRDRIEVALFSIEDGWCRYNPELWSQIPEGAAERLTLKPNQIAILTVDGQPTTFLEPGHYILWQQRADVRPWVYDTEQIVADMPEVFAKLVPRQYLQRTQIHHEQRGILWRDGVAIAYLEPGRHYLWSNQHDLRVDYLDVETTHIKSSPELRELLPEGATEPLEVQVDELAIVYKNGRPKCCLGPGSFLLWQLRARVNARIYDTTAVQTTIPENCWDLVPSDWLTVHTIHPYERGLLYVDGKFQDLLTEGRFGIHQRHRDVQVVHMDMREQEFQISGQEVMTTDKVTLRVNLIIKYRVRDALLANESHTDLTGALYTEVQMAARRQIGGAKLESLLEDRQRIREAMVQELAVRARGWGVEIMQVDLKDIILPGEMKELLNRVIEAEKQAEANVILRREEAAANRAQANAAKVMSSNSTLMRLKELEVLREVAGNISNLTVNVGTDELPFLTHER